jgi:catechol 2,3-dioxygenase-like lactoylglutathione lyase family enzyme
MLKGIMLFGLGLLVGSAFSQGRVAPDGHVRGLNHVGIVVKDYKQAMEFYTQKLGIAEAYTIKRPDGSPQLTYLQLSRDTFIELIPAGPNQQPGITHFGIEVGDVRAAAAELQRKGVSSADPSPTPANALSTRIRDVDNVQIEVMEFGPQSLQRKAIENWK